MRYKAIKPARVDAVAVTSRTICDFCGAVTRGDDWPGCNDSEVTIEAKLGDNWPEEDCRDLETVDACPKCWTNKIVPVLQAIMMPGAKVRQLSKPYEYASDCPLDPEAT